jgi:hypothetical protein
MVQIISRAAEAYGWMMLDSGLFQADGHPGNILAMPRGVVGLIDYGQSKQLTDKERYMFAWLVVALAECVPPPLHAPACRCLRPRLCCLPMLLAQAPLLRRTTPHQNVRTSGCLGCSCASTCLAHETASATLSYCTVGWTANACGWGLKI